METSIRFVTPVKWILHRRRLLAFASAFGEGAAGEVALRKLAALDPVLFGRPDRTGTACAVAKLGGGTAGVAIAVDRGREAFIVVVHPALRGRGIGAGLTRALLERTGALELRVPVSDVRTVAMCRRAGLAEAAEPAGADDGFVRLAGGLKPAGNAPGISGWPEPAAEAPRATCGSGSSAKAPEPIGMPGPADAPEPAAGRFAEEAERGCEP